MRVTTRGGKGATKRTAARTSKAGGSKPAEEVVIAVVPDVGQPEEVVRNDEILVPPDAVLRFGELEIVLLQTGNPLKPWDSPSDLPKIDYHRESGTTSVSRSGTDEAICIQPAPGGFRVGIFDNTAVTLATDVDQAATLRAIATRQAQSLLDTVLDLQAIGIDMRQSDPDRTNSM